MRRHVGPVQRLATAALAFGIVLGAVPSRRRRLRVVVGGRGPARLRRPGRLPAHVRAARTTYRAGEAIEGQATLGVVGGSAVAFGSSGGGPFVFDVAEVGGLRRVGGAMTADCAPYRLEPGRPMMSAIIKSGGYSADDPEAAFAQAFLDGNPVVSLPAGDWRITAGASLVEGEGCSGASRSLAAPIVIHVIP